MTEATNFNVCHVSHLETAKLQSAIGTFAKLNNNAVHMVTGDGCFMYHTIHPISDIKNVSVLRTSLSALCELKPYQLLQVANFIDKLRNQEEMRMVPTDHLIFPHT